MRRIFFFSLLIGFSSCIKSNQQNLVASVYEKDLYMKDLLNEMPQQTTDTSFFKQHYIDNWIRKELMLYHAEINLSTELKNYEKKIEEYRSSLLIHVYQQELINQNFDTTITEQQIENYYDQYKSKFKLQKNIFKGRFVILDKEAPNQAYFHNLFYLQSKTDNFNLLNYCQQFAKEYYLQDSVWQYFNIITKQLPIEIEKESNFLTSKSSLELEDDKYNYFLLIKDYQLEGSVSPLEVEYEKIKMVILNKNKLRYLKKLEDDLYHNALNNEKIKIY